MDTASDQQIIVSECHTDICYEDWAHRKSTVMERAQWWKEHIDGKDTLMVKEILWVEYRWDISARFSSNSEAIAEESWINFSSLR